MTRVRSWFVSRTPRAASWGHIGPGGKAGRSKAAAGTAKRRGPARAQRAQGSGLERYARAGVLPTKEAVQ